MTRLGAVRGRSGMLMAGGLLALTVTAYAVLWPSAPGEGVTAPPLPPERAAAVLTLARTVVTKLPTSQHGCNETADSFDYFPDGGVRTWFCHLHDIYNLTAIEQLTGLPVFLAGPHQVEMDMQSAGDFGRYNPAFLLAVERVMDDHAAEILSSDSVPFLKEKALPILTDMVAVLNKIDQNPTCFGQDLAYYRDEIIASRVHVAGGDIGDMDAFGHSRWCRLDAKARYQLDANADSVGLDFASQSPYPYFIIGNIYRFFLRREMDGTRPIFARIIRKAHAALTAAG